MSEKGLVRELGLTEALAIGLGTMIGAGIFVLSAIATQRAGPGAAVSYVAAGLIVLPIAMIISEMATGMPEAGGSYHLISRALGPLAGAVVGPGNWLGLTFATGFYLIGFAQYVAHFVSIPTRLTALAAGLFFVVLNYRGAKLSGQVQNIIVVILLLILALFVGRGLFDVDPELHRPFVPNGWSAVVSGVGLVIVSFTGFEKISTISEEIKRPDQNLPLAIVGSVVIATVLYGTILYVTTGVLPYQTIADLRAPLVEAADRFMSVVGVVGMSLAALLATASSANAAIMASSRINFAMGRDRILPGWFNEIHPHHQTPYRSIVVTGSLAILLALSGQAEVLAEISSALFMISYALLSLGLLVLHRSRPSWYEPAYRAPLYPWLPVLAGGLVLMVITTMEQISQIAGLGLIGLSLLWYVAWGRRKTPVEGELGPWLERERPHEAVLADVEQATEAGRHEILVPVANPATTKSLVSLAGILARGRTDTEIAALKIVTVPFSLPLSIAQRRLDKEGADRQDILRRAAKHGAKAGLRIKMLLHAAHGVASGIVGVAEGRPVRLMILGWHGPFTLSRVRTSIDQEVVRAAPCNVAVLRDRGLDEVQRVLIPVGGGPHARLGLRLADELAQGNGAELVVLRVRQPGDDAEAQEAALKKLIGDELGETDTRVSARMVSSHGVVAGILEEAEDDYDLLVIGASEQWFLRNWLFGAIPDVVAERAPCSVLLVRKHEPAPVSWLRRMI